ERQRVEEDPGAGEVHEERRDDHAGDADHHQPPRRLREHAAGGAQLEADLLEHPVREPHHGEAGPADERAEAVRRHERVPGVRRELADARLALPDEHPEEAGGEQDDRRGDEVTADDALRRHGVTWKDAIIDWWPTPQNSRQSTVYVPVRWNVWISVEFLFGA